jgi:hypothetical protein
VVLLLFSRNSLTTIMRQS